MPFSDSAVPGSALLSSALVSAWPASHAQRYHDNFEVAGFGQLDQNGDANSWSLGDFLAQDEMRVMMRTKSLTFREHGANGARSIACGSELTDEAAYAFARTCRAGAESWAGRRHGLTFAEVRERVDEHFQIGHFQISRKKGMEILLRPHDGPSTGSVRIFAIAASLGLLVRARWIRLAADTEHVCALAQALASGACWKLEELYLPRSKIGDGGVLALCDAGLQGALSRLHRLHLGGNLISDAGACALSV
ncbi:hypothetical protein EMIHUDRAFT_196188 [Emiliania huxleyi CCMP1516]|uniref:Uncharacterized protein n=2 Tax=Emiliania huxleyi TaxID=2903 RepID=A0A0D3J3M3_EMIH1|nr:hypothetical protein EMIHUDRAFT_196188 [Emiliania huxleyi CCMP1516]EOD18108.1 hypothetical protein EMIHUDRAFT_196188 [Emiliania huxleyi CCMP1516]|eukprot:XP_005770537.1 hypothetical protein EMIHUDRAFT_196188 [Emiliania huxleyi CCMP1516]